MPQHSNILRSGPPSTSFFIPKIPSFLPPAKPLEWIWNSVPKARSYTTAGSKVFSVGRVYNHTRDFNYPFLGARVSSDKLREKTLYAMQSRHYYTIKGSLSLLNDGPLQVSGPLDLPSPPAIDFRSPDGDQLLTESSQEGFSDGLMPLLVYTDTVIEPRFNGLTSISTVLNSLEVMSETNMQRRLRYPFEFLLDSCDSFEKVRAEGLSLQKLAFLAYSNGAKVDYFPAYGSNIDDFRNYIKKCTSSKDCYMVAFFDRSIFKQAGGWHICPIGAYHAGRDLAFVVENSLEYPWFWIPLELLWESIITIDQATRSQKGNFKDFIKKVDVVNSWEDESLDVAKLQSETVFLQEQLLIQLQDTELYKLVSNWLDSQNSNCELVTLCDLEYMHEVGGNAGRHIEQVVPNFGSSSRNYSKVPAYLDDDHTINTVELPNQVARKLIPSSHSALNGSTSKKVQVAGSDALTMLLFALPPNTWSGINDAKLSTELYNVVSIENLPPLLSNEILSLRQQLQLLVMDFD